MEPPWAGGKKVCSNIHDHMTKMATMPIYGTPFKNLLWNRLADVADVLKYFQVCSNDDPRLTFA